MKPLGARVLVLPNKSEEVTESGLIIPKIAQERQQVGKVQEVGPGTPDDPMTVAEGDEIIYNLHSGTPVQVGDFEYLILRVSDILAIL